MVGVGDWVLRKEDGKWHWYKVDSTVTESCIASGERHFCEGAYSTPAELMQGFEVDWDHNPSDGGWKVDWYEGAPSLRRTPALKKRYGKSWCYFNDLPFARHSSWSASDFEAAKEWARNLSSTLDVDGVELGEPVLVEEHKEESMSMKEKLIGNPGQDAAHAGYLVAARQLVQTAKTPIVAALVDEWARVNPDLSKRKAKKFKKHLHRFFESEFGDLFLGYALAAALQAMPIPGMEDHREMVAHYLRIDSMGAIGNRLANVLMEPLRAAMEGAIISARMNEAPKKLEGSNGKSSFVEDAVAAEAKIR